MVQMLDAADRRHQFDGLYRAHYAAIYAYVYRRLGSVAEVPDVTADVFAVAWRRIENVPAAPEDRLWLYGVARRRVMRAQRTGARYTRLQVRLREHARETAGASAAPGSEVREAIARLRSRDREVLMLVTWEGLSHAETAEVMGCSANAVALRVSRARERLRTELDPSGPASRRSVHEQKAQG